MILCFELSMPGVGSWNGQWSGASRYYAKVVNVGRNKARLERARAALAVGRFHHAWEDGWRASVTVCEVDARDAASIRRRSNGFCGYDWMVDSILKFGRIDYDARGAAPTEETR